VFLATISLVINMWVQCLVLDSLETQDFDVKLQVFQQHMQKQVLIVIQPFLSFLLSFQECKVHNMSSMMLDPHFKGLRLVVQYVGKEKAALIVGECDRYVLFP
jgi:hypothetical protein